MKLLGLLVITVALMLAGTLAIAHFSNSNSEAAAPFQAGNITVENDTNRPGSDYRNFDVQADPNACRTACWNDATCKAYTYVKPGVQGQYAHCWLKNSTPTPSANNCCVSGVKTGGDTNSGLEVDVNRRGGDYQDFELKSNNPYDCRQACSNDGRCASFTYVRPSFFGQYSHCFLKNSVPGGTQDGCCISGVLRSGGGGGGGGGNTGGANFSGTWDSSEGDTLHLTQSGDNVTGNYDHPYGKVEGTVSGKRLRFRWTQGTDTGTGTLILSDDGRSFTGWWSRSNNPDDKSGGGWSGRRK